MAIELSAIAAGLPMAASFAMAGGFLTLREGRRRSALNAAMHELRRPLQALSLALPAASERAEPLESSLRMAVAAAERLDREINGAAAPQSEPVPLRPLVEAAMARWRPAARREGRLLRMRWIGPDPILAGDPIALSQALDNLISNSLEHGGGEIAVLVDVAPCQLRLTVRDEGVGGGGRRRRDGLQRLSGRNRRGHGLGIARRAVASHGGAFRLERSAEGSEAKIVLPLRREGQ